MGGSCALLRHDLVEFGAEPRLRLVDRIIERDHLVDVPRHRLVEPPLALWAAYATRALGRARMEVGDTAGARTRLEAARAGFTQFGNPLGQALADWDLARLVSEEARASDHEIAAPPDWFAPAWALGSLGLGARVAKLLADRRRTGGVVDLALAASAQAAPHLAVAQEIELIYGDPTALAAIASLLISPIYLVKFSNGETLGLVAFVAAIVGGFNQVRGAVLGVRCSGDASALSLP